jgi:serine/threonine-protein kinase
MALEIGSRLGHYDVTALIGEGGMGQVYQATDTKLNRQVALKILPEAFASDPDRLARFQREAQVLASLNHPNIAQIHGLEDSEGTKALVLELVEGPTLADRIAQGPIPLDEALPIAKQIAEALEAAHEAGVIHRDLKPANIKVRDDGTVKVLDFGLAKAFQPDASDVSQSMSPTISLTAAATQMGMVIGTAAYMAPEQARGKLVDKRADIFAFGVVLYEMLTGQRPFQGEDVSLTLAAVMTFDADLDRLPETFSPTLKTYLARCLAKDPKERLRDIGDVRLAMEGAFETTVSASIPEPTAAHPAAWRLLPWVAAVLLAVITGIAVWSLMRPPAPRVERFAIPPPAPETMGISQGRRDIAISPDGSTVVYSVTGGSPFQLYVRPVDALTATPLVGGPGTQAYSPFVSANNAWVGFLDNADRRIKKVSILGGPRVDICDPGAAMLGATWAEDDTTIIFGNSVPSGLWRVSANGGEPEEVSTPDIEQGVNHGWPRVLPGGRAVLFTILTSETVENAQIAMLDLDSGEHRVLFSGGSAPRYSPTGHIVYGVSGTLRAVGFDLNRLEVTNPNPVPVLDGVSMKPSGAANFDLAGDGSLVYVEGTGGGVAPRTLVWVDRAGREEPLETPELAYEQPRIARRHASGGRCGRPSGRGYLDP